MADIRDLGRTLLAAAALLLLTTTALAWAGPTERVCVGSGGRQGDGSSGFFTLAISADGRFVAFFSAASNLVPGDTNGHQDVFVHDRQTGSTERASVATDGTQSNGSSYYALSLSADGRFVAFTSDAGNLVPGDTSGFFGLFVRDRQTGTTERVSVSSSGAQGNGTSSGPSLSP